jgi:ferritin-like metal-binding protein YciE
MQRIQNLEELLLHYVRELYAAEQHTMAAMPAIIEKAKHASLKKALKHHADLTKEQVKRLQSVVEQLTAFQVEATGSSTIGVDVFEKKHECKGMIGLIEEAEMLVHGDIDRAVLDAAIIGAVQKMEHYEICAYGTAFAYARELNITGIAALLNETLEEEYNADDLLTALATSSYNKNAEPAERRKQEPDDSGDQTQQDLYTGPGGHETSTSNRTLKSPGGRAGTSHRGYGNGESRGH